MASLKIKNLKKSFGNTTVINNISFAVNEGEFCILLGPSGCGKTTVLRLIAGLDRQDGGEIFIDEKEVSELSPKERDVAMVFQSYALYPHMSVYENMAFSLRMQKMPEDLTDKKVREAAGLLDIEALLNRKPGELSGGQRQRVAVGRAIVRNPRLFLFDEPLSNLDAKLRNTMRVELAKLHHALKATMIYVTHDQIEAMTLGEKIVLFNNGVIQQIGTPKEMYERPSNLFAAIFIGSPRINLIEGRLVTEKNTLFFQSEGLMIDVGTREELKAYSEKNITMGVRPESLTPGDGPIKGDIELIEHIGSEALVYLMAGNSRLIVKTPPDFNDKTGRTISLKLNTAGLHFFYEGTRI